MRDLPACHPDRRASTHQGAQRCHHPPVLLDRCGPGSINGTTTEFRHARSWHKNKGRFPTVSRKLPTLTLVNLFGCGWRDLEPANEAHSRLQICADGKEPFARFIVRVWMCRFCRLC